MNYPRSKISKHSDYFLINYGYSNCATCAISGKVAGIYIYKWKLLKDDLKYISTQNNCSNLLKQISDNIIVLIYGYATCATYGTSGIN